MLPVDHVVAAELKAGRRNEVVDQSSGRHDGRSTSVPRPIAAYTSR